MARLLAIEWDAREIRVAVARRHGKEAEVELAFAVDLPAWDSAAGDDFPDVGHVLGKELAARGLTRSETLVAVGRTSIELRVLTIPPAPPEDLPDLVRFQALKQFSTLGDNWPLDFVPLENTDGASNVLAASISPDMVTQIRQTCEAAHVEAKHLVLRPFAAAALWRRRDASPRCALMVDLLTDEADLTVLVDGQVAFLRTVRLPSSADSDEQVRAMLGEIRRTIAAAQNQLTGRRVERIILCDDGADHALLKPQLEQQLSLDVEYFDPFSALPLTDELRSRRPAHPGRFAPLLGMLADEAAGTSHAIDFLHPRKRPEAVSYRRRNSLIAAAAAAVVLAGAGIVWLQYNDLASQANALQKAKNELDNTLKQKLPLQKEVANIDAFTIGDVTWLDELYWLSDRFLRADQSIVTEATWQSLPQSGSKMQVDGYARDAALLDELERRLRDPRHAVGVHSSIESQQDNAFRWKFDGEIGVTPEEPEERFGAGAASGAIADKPAQPNAGAAKSPAAAKSNSPPATSGKNRRAAK